MHSNGAKLNLRIAAMYISLANSRTGGFKRWSNAHRPDNDDDNSGGATPIAVRKAPTDECHAIEEALHRPWLVPGVGCSL